MTTIRHQQPQQQQQSFLISSISILAISATTGFTSYLCYCYYSNSKKKRNTTCCNVPDDAIISVIPQQLQSSPYINELTLAIKLALECGNNIYQHCYNKGTIAEEGNETNLLLETKGQPEDFCTMIDIQNEQIVTNGIRTNFPNHHIIGEESVGTGIIPKLDPNIPTWIIDPIDGTTNFVSGIPISCVSIGLCINGLPTLGVIYAPMTNELYIGIIGYGAYRNGILITNHNKKNQTLVKKSLKESVIGFEFGYVRDTIGIDLMIQVLHNIMLYGCRTVRSLGSGVLDIVYVATGKLDIIYAGIATEGFKPWDYCAAYVIINESGCIIDTLYKNEKKDKENNNSNTNNHNNVFDIYSKSVICAVNQSLIDEFRQEILKQS